MSRRPTPDKLLLLGCLFLVSCGLAAPTSAPTHRPDAPTTGQRLGSPLQPVHSECLRGTASSVADHLYRDHKNYRTISQALFPTDADHSLIVWVDIAWWNATQGPPGVRHSWAWSTSCLYVVLPLELFPLLSIWVFNPEQRMKEVTVSLPPFCANVTAEQANTALYLSIKRMEAYVRNRDDPDPDLSMAQCVVAFDDSGEITSESDEVGLDKAYLLFYLNLAVIGLLVLALVFLAVQYLVDWINVDRQADFGESQSGGLDGDGGSGHLYVGSSAKFEGVASAVDGRGRPVAETYGSVGHQAYVNDQGHVVHVASDESDYTDDDDDTDDDYNNRGEHCTTGEMGDFLHDGGGRVGRIMGHRLETGAAAAGARRNSRHRLHEGEVAQIKGGLQRCRARIARLRSELASLEADLAQGSAAAASLRAAGQIKIANGEVRVIEQEILLCEAEARMLEEVGACSLFKVKEMKYDFLMMKREMLDLKKRLWEAEKAAWTAEADLRRRKQRSAVWETYLAALIDSPFLCDLLCASLLAFLVNFYKSMLVPFPKSTVIPLFVVNLVCFVPWLVDFVRHRLCALAFALCCSCFLLCERRRSPGIVASARAGEGELEMAEEEAESSDRKANVWVLLPIVVVLVLHFAFFLTWIALATMFDFAYSLEIICLLVVMLFHLFMSVKLVLKIVRRIREDEAEAKRAAAGRAREETDYEEEAVFDEDRHKDEARAAVAEEDERGTLARACGWCPGPVRACVGGWLWFLLMMVCLLAALVVFLVWLHAGYHTFARQKTAGLQLLLTFITLLVLLLERQVINLDMSRRGYLRSFPRLVRRLLLNR